MHQLRGPLAAALCATLACPPITGWAQNQPRQIPRPPSARSKPQLLRGDERILHALNRLTFGPRPGELEAVRAEGLDRWFAQQLHPASLDETALNARLAQYPAMRLNSQDLLARFPSNAMIRQAIDGKIAPPDRGIAHAVYQDQMYRVAARREQKEQKQQATANIDTQPMQPATNQSARNSYNAPARRQDALDEPDRGTGAGNASSATDADVIASAALLPAVLALPPERRVARLAALSPAQAEEFFQSVKGPDRASLLAGLTPEQRETVGALENPQRAVVEELTAERLTRDIYANSQLQEVMTDFWLNHFNVFLHKNEATPYQLVSYERDVIRPRALGKFEDLLEATAHSPAMLLYLDNAGSIGPDSIAAQRAKLNALRNGAASKKAPEGLNENYARELMELHTLGVNGGYTQADVTQVARILTGWTVDRPQRGGDFKFEPNRHEPGTKKVMGKKFDEDGEREGRDLLHFLATRPATARFIARKLAVRFVSDDPPATLVDRMANAYLTSDGDVAVVLKTMFHAPEFWSTNVDRVKVKTPLEYVVSVARAGDDDVTNMQPLVNALRDMGMPLFGAVPPTGYKWDAAAWVSTGALVARMNFALTFAASRLPGNAVQWSATENITPVPAETEEARLEQLLIPGGVSQSTRRSVLAQFSAQASNPPAVNRPAQPLQVNTRSVAQGGRTDSQPLAQQQEKRDQILAGLLLGSPEFQRR